MRICKECGEKFSFRENLKSSYKRDGRIECKKCNSVFVLKKENVFTWILGFLSLYIVLSICDKVGGVKGIVVALAIGIIEMLILLNIDSRYIIKK